jgi:hypothetical protein
MVDSSPLLMATSAKQVRDVLLALTSLLWFGCVLDLSTWRETLSAAASNPQQQPCQALR